METFDTIWESSRTNAWSFAYPTVLFFGVISILMLQRIRSGVFRRLLIVLSLGAFFLLAIEASSLTIAEKWQIRGDWARSHFEQLTEDQKRGVTSDGANLALGPIIGGFSTLPFFFGAAMIADFHGIRRANWNRDVPCESEND